MTVSGLPVLRTKSRAFCKSDICFVGMKDHLKAVNLPIVEVSNGGGSERQAQATSVGSKGACMGGAKFVHVNKKIDARTVYRILKQSQTRWILDNWRLSKAQKHAGASPTRRGTGIVLVGDGIVLMRTLT
jgi:hypothetical protein